MTPSASQPSEPSFGMNLGGYQLVRLLGRGGMGTVWAALHPQYGEVAIKLMRSSLAGDQAAIERFRREGRLAQSIRHERIVQILETGEDRGMLFISMELLSGIDLGKYLERDPIPDLAITLSVAIQVAMGLHVAHERGLIHRDIKPQNIWLSSETQRVNCKILDFGLARRVVSDTVSSQAGTMMGTPAYMSPEQFELADLDQRADLFSFGVMLYFMTTGRLPFQAEEAARRMFQILNEDPIPPITLNRNLPRELNDLILHLLEKDRDLRVPTAASARDRLFAIYERLQRNRSGDESTPKFTRAISEAMAVPPRTNRLAWFILGSLSLILVVLTLILLFRTPKPLPQVELPPPAEPLDATVEGGVPPEKIREAQAAWAKQLNLPAKFSTPLGNGVNIDWILIPPGRFSMGSSEEQIQKLVQAFPSTQLRFFNNEPLPHPVTIDKPFYLSRTEITRGQFARMVQAKNYRTQMEDDEGGWGWDFQLRGFAGPKPEFSWKETNWKTDDSHPVVNVTWIDAEVMGNWLLDQPTLFPMKVQAIRLPKEVEWEFAARAGTTTLYATGSDDPASLKGIANLADRSLLRAYEKSVVDALDDDDRYPFTAPVGSFPPNAFGLNDLTGNVWEWCRERWGILAPAVSRVPIEPNIGKSEARVIRGGGWQEPPWKCRPGYRLKSEEGTLYIGFRLVLTWE